MFGANPMKHITEYHSSYFQALWWLHHVMCILVIVKDWEVFQDKKNNGMELSTGKILEVNLVPSAFNQTLGD
jgi:hypothetical protein